jgi:hypothetical protein
MNRRGYQPEGELCRGIRIINHPGEADLSGLIGSACAGSLETARDLWGLPPPRDCHLYVVTSWLDISFRSAPWYLRPLVISSMPFWAPPLRRIWPRAGAITLSMHFGRRVTIGVKPPRLLQSSDTSVGRQLFVPEKDMQVKLRHLVCHELTHACSSRLRLPMWLNEGIAMRSVDHYLGRRTISADTLALLRETPPRCPPPNYRQMSRLDARAATLHIARGYWLVERLERTQPGFLKDIFSDREKLHFIERHMADLLGLNQASFWQEVDALLA